MVKLCRLWPGHANYVLLKISSFKIKREFMPVMYNCLNRLTLLIKNKRFYCPKNFGRVKKF